MPDYEIVVKGKQKAQYSNENRAVVKTQKSF